MPLCYIRVVITNTTWIVVSLCIHFLLSLSFKAASIVSFYLICILFTVLSCQLQCNINFCSFPTFLIFILFLTFVIIIVTFLFTFTHMFRLKRKAHHLLTLLYLSIYLCMYGCMDGWIDGCICLFTYLFAGPGMIASGRGILKKVKSFGVSYLD